MKRFCSSFVFLFLAFSLSAQTADLIEELLEIKAVSWEQTAAFILEAADVSRGEDSALDFAAENKWLPKNADLSGSPNLQEVSLLLMKAFGIKGGIFYSMFKNPHYAYRELVFMEIIQGRSDPKMAVSGEHMIYLVSRIYSLESEE